jgi:hypothetical protein
VILTADLDPVTIRKALTDYKRRGIPFDTAWLFVVGEHAPNRKGRVPDDGGMREFMRKHFGAAYRNVPTPLGRFSVARTDESQASPHEPTRASERDERAQEILRMYRSGHTMQEVGDTFGVTRQRVSQVVRRAMGDGRERRGSRLGLCRSGDGCDRKAGHGRFGSFCRYHADELALLSEAA